MAIRNRKVSTRTVKASELIPNPLNWRTHPSGQRDALQAVLTNVGDVDYLKVVETDDGLMLIDGHLRADLRGDDDVDVVVLDLNEDEQRLILATFDPLAAMAERDASQMTSLLEGMTNGSPDLSNLLHTLDVVPKYPTLNLIPVDNRQDQQPAEPPPDYEPFSKRGQIWQLGEHRLMCGDSTDIEDVEALLDGVTVEMLFTDPPYGVDYDGGHFNLRRREKLEGDANADIYDRFLSVVQHLVDGPCYMFFAGTKGSKVYNAIEERFEIHALLVWHKTNAKYAAMNAQYKHRHEPFLYFKPARSTLRWCGATTESTLWELDRDAQNEYHPTQKPVALVAKAINNHTSQTILDPFVGSGTTIIAAEKLNRRCYAMEIEPKYVDVSIRRWEEFTGQKAELVSE